MFPNWTYWAFDCDGRAGINAGGSRNAKRNEHPYEREGGGVKMEFIFRRTYRGPVKAVILDWAGTAVDYGSFAPTAVFLRLFESRNVKITAADARSGMGLMKKDHILLL